MIVLTIFLMIGISQVRPSGESESTLVGEIRKVLDDSEEGWNSGNIEKYMECYLRSDRMRFAGNGSFNLGWENTLKRYKKGYPDQAAMGTLSFSDVDIPPICTDAALVFGRWTLHYPDKKRTGLYTLLMRKFDNGWRIVHDHSSSEE